MTRTTQPAESRPRRTKPHSKRQTAGPVLTPLALTFLLAGLLRLGAGIGTAMAEGPELPAQQSAALSGTPTATTPLPETWDSATSAAILVQMTQREQALRLREASLSERENLLEAAAERLGQQIDALERAEQALAATMALADRAAEADIERLVRVFESMKPDEAARVFTEMDPAFAAGFLARLPPDAAAAVMAGLEPQQAYLLSTIVAGRNALVPRDS